MESSNILELKLIELISLPNNDIISFRKKNELQFNAHLLYEVNLRQAQEKACL